MADIAALPPVPFAPASGEALPAEALWLSDVWARERSAEALVPPLHQPQRVAFDLVIVVEGRGRHVVDFEPFDVEAGDVVLIPTGSAQHYVKEARFEARLVLMPPGASSPLAGQGPLRHRPPPGRLALLRRLHDLMVGFRQSEPGPTAYPALRQLGLAAFTAAVPAVTTTETQTSALVRRFEELARRSLPDERRVVWYARELGCSPRTLLRACQADRSRSPKDLLDDMLATEARRTLIDETLSIADVAGRLGFSEPTNFTKWFRRVARTTPRRFRDDLLGGHR